MRKSNQDIITIPTPKKENNLVKPDFSPILMKQNQLSYKKHGSYKKQKFMEPESPMKSPNFKTATNLKGKNLFGSQPEDLKDCKIFKKLNFDDCNDEKNDFLGKKNNNYVKDFFNKNNKLTMLLERCDEKDEDNFNMNSNNNNNLNIIPSPKFENEKSNNFFCSNDDDDDEEFRREKRTRSIRKSSINIDNNIDILKTGKFENEYNAKKIQSGKFYTIYRAEEKKTKKIYCIKKIGKISPKSNINIIKKIVQDFSYNSNDNLKNFCVKYLDFWIEKEEFNPFLSDINFCDKNLYLLTNWYENGDILDYLEKLENSKYNFSENFYWDLVFEMIMGLLFLHECGYMHIDIQPSNYLVDENGYLKLNDFSLAIRVNELNQLDDIIEGNAAYISKELFHFKKESKLNSKCDIFSLGLTLFELIAKIDLPYNGTLWHELRDENFKLSEDYFKGCNIKNYKDFISLISQMILPFEKRPDLKQLIDKFSPLSERYKLLLNRNYKKSCSIPKFCNANVKNVNIKSFPSKEKL